MTQQCEQLKCVLRAKRTSLRAISRELGVSHTIVVQVAKGEQTSARVALALLPYLTSNTPEREDNQ